MKALNSFAKIVTFLLGICLTGLSLLLLTSKTFVVKKAEPSRSALLPKLYLPKVSQQSLVKEYSGLGSFQMLRKANEFHLSKKFLQVITGSVTSRGISTRLINFHKNF